ncbi:MAG: FAD-dependent oxidoreductase, partial [Nanoarchaeota archaeon]
MQQKKIVIIGGGFAGSTAARKLEKDFNVTLIDSKDYFEFTPSVLRTIIEPEHIKKIQALHKNYLNKAVVISGIVKDIGKKDVTTSGRKFPYDYLVICSGSEYNLPMKSKSTVTAARADILAKYSKKLEESNSVLIIGGGLVGVELAAEIIEKYPDKRITIAHDNEFLIER